MKRFKIILMILISWSLSIQFNYSQSITWLGFISPGGAGSSAEGVSADGRIVVGSSSAPSNQYHAFMWSQNTGMIDLGTLGGHTSYAYDISDSGNVIAGRSFVSLVGNVIRGFRWTPQTGMQDLGTLGGPESGAFAVSSDGSSIAGNSLTTDPFSPTHACIWRDTSGLIDLGAPSSNSVSFAYCISSNGLIVGGVARFSSVYDHAAIWSGNWIDLGTLGGNESWAYGISGDGSAVVGSSRTSEGYIHAFRWSATTGMQDLGVLAPGYNSEAIDISSDGSTIIGWASNEYGQDRAVRWKNGGAIEDLNLTYASILGNAKLLIARDVSPDGRYIVGTGYRNGVNEAFILDTSPSVDVELDSPAPYKFSLAQNYPNPFNPSTKISWQSPVRSWQTLKIYDMLGNEIKTLVNEYRDAGEYNVEFNASDLPSGVYYYKLSAGNYYDVKKMIVIK
ncbi:MAG: T9SS type A sorting domain-containing protein [Ignavibacterium sp.]